MKRLFNVVDIDEGDVVAVATVDSSVPLDTVRTLLLDRGMSIEEIVTGEELRWDTLDDVRAWLGSNNP